MCLMPSSDKKPALLPVSKARQRILDALEPTSSTTIPLSQALGRFLADDIPARSTLPPHDVSAMDGYAVRAADVATCPAELIRVGESAAGHPWPGHLESGQAVRIFTGAYVPNGADTIVIQENVDAAQEADNTPITVHQGAAKGRFIRPAGLDISAGDMALAKGTCLSARSIGLATAAGATSATVSVPPRIGILSTGDELVAAGKTPGPGQIISSNAAFLTAFVKSYGAEAVDLGIIKDRPGAVFDAVTAAENLQLVVTTGGASVGSHDHIASDLAAGALDFWKIAMRPGKPLIWGKIGDTGGNPQHYAFSVPLTTDMPENDQRQDYIRATLTTNANGQTQIRPAPRQDSSMMATLAHANAFIVRPPFDPPKAAGDRVDVLPMPRLF